MRALLLIIVAIVLLGGGYYWYMQSATTPTPVETNDPFGTNNTNTIPSNVPPGAVMEDGTIPDTGGTSAGTPAAVKEIVVSNTGMAFNQKSLSVKKGERVKITFQNTGGTHDLRIEGYNVGTKVISAGQSESFEFVANEAGEFEYYCSVGNHRAMGMKGTLTVTE